MRNGQNITSSWHRIRNLFSCRKHSRRAIDKVSPVKVVCVCVCVTLTTMKFVLHRFTYHPFLPTLYREVAKAKTPPKSHFNSQNFSFCSSVFRDIKPAEQCYSTYFGDYNTEKIRTISAPSDSQVGLLIFRLGLFSDVQFLSSLLDQWSDVTRT